MIEQMNNAHGIMSQRPVKNTKRRIHKNRFRHGWKKKSRARTRKTNRPDELVFTRKNKKIIDRNNSLHCLYNTSINREIIRFCSNCILHVCVFFFGDLGRTRLISVFFFFQNEPRTRRVCNKMTRIKSGGLLVFDRGGWTYFERC